MSESKTDNVYNIDNYNQNKKKYTTEEIERHKKMWNFRNLTKAIDINDENVKDYWVDNLISDYDVSKFNMTRYQFYQEFIKILKKNPNIFNKIMKINNDVKLKSKREKNILRKIKQNLQEYKKNKKDVNINNEIEDILSNLSNENTNRNSTLIEGVTKDAVGSVTKDTTTGGGINNNNTRKKLLQKFNNEKEELISNKKKNNFDPYFNMKFGLNISKEKENEILDESNPVQKFIEDYYDAYNDTDGSNKTNEEDIKNFLKRAVNDLESSDILRTLKISRMDRLVFIFITFFIRYITLILVQWSIEVNFIKQFYHAFLLYSAIYIIFFWLIVMFVNVDNSQNNFRSFLYYFYFGINGITRLITHTVAIITILLIPIIVNINSKDDNLEKNQLLTINERKNLLKVLSLLSMFIWIFTSLIAIKF